MVEDPTKRTAASPARKTPRVAEPAARISRATLVGRYVVLEPLGEGGMGVVYKAFDPELDRKIALKLVRADSAAGDDYERLLREAHAMAKLSHPNVVPIFDVGAFGAEVFLAMELVEGATLRGWLAEPRSWRDVLDVFVGAGRGLAAAHAAGMIHRDFKPDNVLIGSDGRARVTDFGLARAEGGAHEVHEGELRGLSGNRLDSQLTMAGSIVGTPAYMAPEQQTSGTLDARTDQFAFCVALYEALFGVRPFDGRDKDRLAAIEAGQLREPTRGNKVPSRVRRAVVKGLAANPEQRHASMDALLGELAIERPRARWPWLVVAVAIGAIAVAAVMRREPAVEPCQDAGARIAVTWNQWTRLRLLEVFRATNSPYASDAWASAAANLDRYAHDWAAMRGDACKATQVRREQTPEVMTLRMACLDRRRVELGDLIDVLDHADESIVLKAPVATTQLEGLAACEDVTALRATTPLPASASARAEIDQLRDQIAKARALRIAGKFQPAMDVIQPLVPRVLALHYRPLEAELDLGLGKLHGFLGDERASRDAGIAGFAAAEAANADAVKIELAGVIAGAAAGLGEFDLGRKFVQVALATLERHPDDTLRMRLDTDLGFLESTAMNIDACIAATGEVLRLHAKLDPKDINGVPSMINMAHCLILAGRGVEAVPYLTRGLDIVRAIYPTRLHPVASAIFFNLGEIASYHGDYADAIEQFTQAHAIVFEASGDTAEADDALVHLAAQYVEIGDYAKALAQLEPFRAKWRGNPDVAVHFGAVLSYSADAHYRAGELDAAEQDAREVLALDKNLLPDGNYDEDYVRFGDVLAARGKLDEAIETFKLADASEKKSAALSPFRCRLLTSLGLAQLARHDPAATATLEEAVALIPKLSPAPFYRASARFALARALGHSARGTELATIARDELATPYPRDAHLREQIAAWLASR